MMVLGGRRRSLFLPDLGGLAYQIEFLAASAFCGFLVAWLVIFILIAVWVYRDAESRRMSGALWHIIVILLGLIGLIIYLIVRGGHPVGGTPPYAAYPSAPPPVYPPPPVASAGAAAICRNCGSPLAPGAGFCPRCGAKI